MPVWTSVNAAFLWNACLLWDVTVCPPLWQASGKCFAAAAAATAAAAAAALQVIDGSGGASL